MKRTISQMNQDAAQTIAIQWLMGCETILANGMNPATLSTMDRMYAQSLLHESNYKGNSRWFLNDARWEQIRPMAISCAKHHLMVLGAERYPLTLAHFTNKN